MRKLLLSAAMFLTIAALAQVNPEHHHVSGYTKKNGTYVKPHEQTNSNRTRNDNYSHKGNVNPYTGKRGTKN